LGPLGFVEVNPLSDHPFGPEAVGLVAQVDRLVLERAPQPLDENVVHAAAPAVYRYPDVRAREDTGKVGVG
jgi:hypothetical protein